jgi:3-hydroxyacyl-[acyl-carrier-protein] dehydratase
MVDGDPYGLPKMVDLMAETSEILRRIPHRPPFLFLDGILELGGKKIKARKYVSDTEDFFRGHYPGNPIMPGVLICESVFQAGAALMSFIDETSAEQMGGVPVLTRISDARFKEMVKPNSELIIEVELNDRLQDAYYLTGRVTCGGEKVLRIEFTCSLHTK